MPRARLWGRPSFFVVCQPKPLLGAKPDPSRSRRFPNGGPDSRGAGRVPTHRDALCGALLIARRNVHGAATCRDESRHGRHECPMPLSFHTVEHRHTWWGGPPGLQPAPWPACREWQALDSSGKERVQGDPRGPGGPPHHLFRIQHLRKLSGIGHECPRHFVFPPCA